jgi:hypothetical protein
MPEAQKKALMAKCHSGKLKPKAGRTCKDAAYAIMTAMEKKKGRK